MYLRYTLKPHFTKETFTIDRPVANENDGDDWRKTLLKTQGSHQKYSDFKLLNNDLSVKKVYPNLEAKTRLKPPTGGPQMKR